MIDTSPLARAQIASFIQEGGKIIDPCGTNTLLRGGLDRPRSLSHGRSGAAGLRSYVNPSDPLDLDLRLGKLAIALAVEPPRDRREEPLRR